MPSEVNKNSSSVPMTFEEKEAVILRAIQSIGREVVKPKIVPSPTAANDQMISYLKQTIERTQAHISQAKWTVEAAKKALEEAERMLSDAYLRENRELKDLEMIALGAGIRDEKLEALFHEVNADCENVDCEPCSNKYRREWQE